GPHVGEPDGRRQQLRLAAPRAREEPVDLLQDLLGLALDPGGGIGGDLAGEIDGVAVDDGLAHARPNVVTRHGHRMVSLDSPSGRPRARRSGMSALDAYFFR